MGTLDPLEPSGASRTPLSKKEEEERGTWSRGREDWKEVAPNTKTHLGAEVLSAISCLTPA